jgi:hypothetical protein
MPRAASRASPHSASSARTSACLSRLQLSEESLIRLGQKPSKDAAARGPAGRGVLHRLQRAEDAAHRAALPRHLDRIGIDYQVMGGPTHCCGTAQLRAGDIDTLGVCQQHHQQAVAVESKQVLAWCRAA